VIGISYGHIFGGLLVLFVALVGNSASKTGAALVRPPETASFLFSPSFMSDRFNLLLQAFFIADTIAIVCHVYFPGQWTPAPLEISRFIRYGSCALSLVAILAGGGGSQRPSKAKSS
jgi:hypothetical protein